MVSKKNIDYTYKIHIKFFKIQKWNITASLQNFSIK